MTIIAKMTDGNGSPHGPSKRLSSGFGIMAAFGGLVRSAEGGGSCVHEPEGIAVQQSYGKRSKQKSPYGLSYNMEASLQKVMSVMV